MNDSNWSGRTSRTSEEAFGSPSHFDPEPPGWGSVIAAWLVYAACAAVVALLLLLGERP